MATKVKNYQGQTIVAHSVRTVGGKKKDASLQVAEVKLALLQIDVDKTMQNITDMGSDSIITPAEKYELQREWNSIQATFPIITSQVEKYGMQNQLVYTNYVEAYERLSGVMETVLEQMDQVTDMSGVLEEGETFAGIFSTYFDKQKLINGDIFQYSSGLLQGLDDRTKFTLQILGATVLIEGETITLSVKLLDAEGADVTEDYPDSDFTWTGDAAGSGKALDIAVTGVFMCQFKHFYSETMFWQAAQVVTIGDAVPGAKGDKGDPGPAGPSGTPGLLGVSTDGLIISVRGFDSDGDFGADTGYIYAGSQRITVIGTDYECTGTGQGYILCDTSGNLYFTKLVPQSDGTNSWMEWQDYNSGTVVSGVYVIGMFSVSRDALTAEIIGAVTTNRYIIQNFMTMLAGADSSLDSDLNLWARAMGIEKVFQRLAIIEAFINQLWVHNVQSSDYQEDSTEAPTKGFKLDGPNNLIKVVDMIARNIQAQGKFKTTNEDETVVFQTQEKLIGKTVSSSPGKMLWAGSSLYTGVSLPEETLAEVSGTYGSIGITHATKLPSDSSTALLHQILNVAARAEGAWSSPSTVYMPDFIIPNGANQVTVSFNFYRYLGAGLGGHIYIEKNGSTIIDINSSYGSNSWKSYQNVFSGNQGDVFRLRLAGGSMDNYVEVNTGNFVFRSSLSGKGIYLKLNDGSSLLVGYSKYFNTSLTLSGWDSSSHKDFISGSDLISTFSGYSLGEEVLTNPDTSSVTINGTIHTGIMRFKRESSHIFFSDSGDVTVTAFGGNGSSVGVYTALSCSVVLLAQSAGVLTDTLMPTTTEATVGTQGNPYRKGFMESLEGGENAGNIGSPSYSYKDGYLKSLTVSGNISAAKVYGAVAN